MDEKHIPLSGTNSIGDDAYFLTSKDNPNHFLKPDGEQDGDPIYRLLEGPEGAAIWHLAEANTLIEVCGLNNIIPIKVSEVLGHDESKN